MRANWKLGRLERYPQALRTIQEHGIRVNGCFVLGLDGQGPEIFDQVRAFVADADLFAGWTSTAPRGPSAAATGSTSG